MMLWVGVGVPIQFKEQPCVLVGVSAFIWEHDESVTEYIDLASYFQSAVKCMMLMYDV